MKQAKQVGADVVILDTAGRLHIDDELMEQLKRIDRRVEPGQVYLVVDGMTGQDAVNSAKAFNDALELDGVIMTKLDGDAAAERRSRSKRSPACRSSSSASGEHLDALEEFHPDRMAGRILGQGDILTLVEKAQREFDQDEMLAQEERLRKGEFTLDDFRKMLNQIRRLGPAAKGDGHDSRHGRHGRDDGRRRSRRRHATHRRHHRLDDAGRAAAIPTKLIDQSRRRRIAAGRGVDPHEVNELVKQFDGMAQLMTKMATMGMRDRMKAIGDLQRGGMMNPGASLAREKQGTGKRLSPPKSGSKQREKEIQREKETTNEAGLQRNT